MPTPESAPAAPRDDVHPTSHETIVVLDFGAQYAMLIARRVREANVYCELLPWDVDPQRARALTPRGVILSGGPASVYEPGAPHIPDWVWELEVPVLGICYGMQALARQLGGAVALSAVREYGPATVEHDGTSPLFHGLPRRLEVWMSHGDKVSGLPPGFRPVAQSEGSPVAAMEGPGGRYGLQFHPEVAHTPLGRELLRNFLYEVCGLRGDWTPGSFIDETVSAVRARVGEAGVVCALSGGVDSAVTAALIHRAVADRLVCVFVDNGLLRRGEREEVEQAFRRHMGIPLVAVDAAARFLDGLRGITDPERKRKVIGETFIRVFEETVAPMRGVEFLAQGTTYPDVVESAGVHGNATAVIKSHHNVGGLPERMHLKLVEPLRTLFKDEVRRVGLALGLPEDMVFRHPFPGPGLAVRVLGEASPERVEVAREADAIVMEEVRAAGLYGALWQTFAVLTNARSVGVMGDYRTYGHVIAVRAVTAEDAMTADWARLPHETLARIAQRIVNEVPGVNRVVYDITSKPPSTIEWE